VSSFVKKMLRKKYDAPAEMGDRAAARVVCLFQDDRNVVIATAKELFDTRDWDDKRAALRPNQLGYLGVHCQVILKDEPELAGLECELQIHTVAENAWSAPLHDLVYKPPEGHVIPDEILRLSYRLAALIEVYDSELSRARSAVLALPGYRFGQILRTLDTHFFRYTARGYDRALSGMVLDALEPLFHYETAEAMSGRIDSFVVKHDSKLSEIFIEYNETTHEANAFIFQPEGVLIFELIDRDFHALRVEWEKSFDLSYLEPFAHAWGLSLD
jgi:hypothetical protein